MIHSEQTKLLATAFNNLGVGAILAGVIVPTVNGTVADIAHVAVWVALGVCLIAYAQVWLGGSEMDFATYWLVVPLVGLALMAPAWAWLIWSLRHKRKVAAE